MFTFTEEVEKLTDPEARYAQGLFMSNLCFLHDIISVARKVDHSLSKKEKSEKIKSLLAEINKNLPSFVFVPSDRSSL